MTNSRLQVDHVTRPAWTAVTRGRIGLLVALVIATITLLAPGVPGSLTGPEAASASVVRAGTAGTLPSPRSRTSAVWANGSAYIFGGRVFVPGQGYGSTREIVKFTPGLGSTVVGQLPPTPQFQGTPYAGRQDTAAIWDGQNAYVFGGYDDSGAPLDEIVRFNPSTNEVQLHGRLRLPTAGASAIWDGSAAYLFGGYVDYGAAGGPPQVSDRIVRFTPGGGARAVPLSLPSPRNHTSAVWDGLNAYIYGGHDGSNALSEIVEFFPSPPGSEDLTDVSVVGRLPSPRHDTAAIGLPASGGYDVVSYVFGGAVSELDENATSEVLAHDPGELAATGEEKAKVVDRLIGVGDPFTGGRAHASAVAIDSVRGYLFGGESGNALSDEVLFFTRPVRYVALGDSYSSGEGLGTDSEPYLEGGAPECHRHRYAYPKLFQFNGPTQLDLFACSGARTEHIYRDVQRFGDPLRAPEEPGYQANGLLRPELNRRTDLVTITIGGNDVGDPDDLGNGGLSEALVECYSSRNCDENADFKEKLRRRIQDELPAKLRSSIAAIKQAAGPDTSIFVLGYPRVFPTDDDAEQEQAERTCANLTNGGSTVDGWTPNEQTYLNKAIDGLNAVSRTVVEAEGVYFVDVTQKFAGHAVCDEPENAECDPNPDDEIGPEPCREGEDWVNGIVDPLPGEPFPPLFNYGSASFHPNVNGQFAYAAALREYIDATLLASGNVRVTPIGLPANPGNTPPPPGPGECAPEGC